jgi:hypothetical protein
MTSSQDVSRVEKPKSILIVGHGWEVNAIQLPSCPTRPCPGTLINIVPSNPQELQPPWTVVRIFFTKVDDVCVEDAEDVCIAKGMIVWIFCKCGVEHYNIAMR